MKPFFWKNLITTILLAVTPSCLWSADLNVRGNVNVQGDGTAASPGTLTVSGKLNVDGGISTHSDISVDGSIIVRDVSAESISSTSVTAKVITADSVSAGDILTGSLATVGNAFSYIFQYFIELSEDELGGDPASRACSLGSWDLCFLSEVRITGEDDQDSDKAECKVTSSQDKGRLTARPEWTLWVFLGNDVNNVRCAAYCLSFSATCTGNCGSC